MPVKTWQGWWSVQTQLTLVMVAAAMLLASSAVSQDTSDRNKKRATRTK